MNTIIITVGNEHTAAGKTIATVQSSGKLSAVNYRDKQTYTTEAQLDPKVTGALLKSLQDQSGNRTDRPGVPDEVRYRFELDDKLVLEIWDNDLEEHRELYPLVKRVKSVLYKQSDGMILL